MILPGLVVLAGHELLPLALERGHGLRFQHLVPPRAEAGRQLALVDGRRERRDRELQSRKEEEVAVVDDR